MAQQTDKQKQEKLIIEIMDADAKDGLYDHIGDTNKMVTMKLYTEEQVRILLDKMSLVTERKNLGVSANFRHRAIEIYNLIKSETPIELLSDEEIEKAGTDLFDKGVDIDYGWIMGAKWMRDKILNK